MTAVYTLAHSCLQSDNSPLSVSPSSVNSNSGISIARRSSLSNRDLHHGFNSSHHGTSISHASYHHHPAYSHSSLSSTSPSVPLSIGNQFSSHSQHSPVALSVSPPKYRANTSPSFSSSFGSNGNGKSGLSNLLQHHARPASAIPLAEGPVQVSSGPIQASVPVPVQAPAPLQAPISVQARAASVHEPIQVPAQAQALLPVQTMLPSHTVTQAGTVPVPALPYIHSLSVIDTFEKVLSEVDIDSCDAAGENAFLVCDLARVYSQYKLWQSELGERIEAFFAVKCNPDPLIIKLMVNLGIGFDCASHQEINSVLQNGGNGDKIIYANPCKASSFIRHAYKKNVNMMTFDNSDELEKIAKFHPNAKMVLRILTDDSGSLCKLGLKFGAPLGEVKSLLLKAKELKVDVIGISFHVGSGCTNPLLFADAVERAKWSFEIGKSLGFNFTLLDVGGGFGGDNFVEIAAILRDAIDNHFPLESGIRIIAEPGRYFVSDAFEMATNIIARRGKGITSSQNKDDDDDEEMDDIIIAEEEEESMVMYYINDGVYGAFNCTMFDHQVVHPKVLTSQGRFISSPSTYFSSSSSPSTIEEGGKEESVEMEACSIWGPTCDSIDCVSSKSFLPISKINVGDWLRWENMGAYTICAASQFNGFKKSKVIYTIDSSDVQEEMEIRRLLNDNSRC